MTGLPLIQQIADRVDRLLLRQEEMLKEQALLRAQVSLLTSERDALLQRLNLARQRVDQILGRLPSETDVPPESDHGVAS